MRTQRIAGWTAIVLSVVAVALLASLHMLSPEFDPAWRMVSEYALGNYGWVLSLMFLAWGLSIWSLAIAIKSQLTTTKGKVGWWIMLVAGFGASMASVFDINHSGGHALAAVLGIGGLPIAALLVTKSLNSAKGWEEGRGLRRALAHSLWISVLLFTAAFGLMTAGFARVYHGHFPDHAPSTLPAGVIGLDGWANRLLIVVYCAWVAYVAWQAIKVSKVSRRIK